MVVCKGFPHTEESLHMYHVIQTSSHNEKIPTIDQLNHAQNKWIAARHGSAWPIEFAARSLERCGLQGVVYPTRGSQRLYRGARIEYVRTVLLLRCQANVGSHEEVAMNTTRWGNRKGQMLHLLQVFVRIITYKYLEHAILSHNGWDINSMKKYNRKITTLTHWGCIRMQTWLCKTGILLYRYVFLWHL